MALIQEMRSRLVASLLALACASVADQTRDQRGPEPDARLERWRAAVERHQPGTIDAAAREIASWPDESLVAVIDDVGELTRFLVRARGRFQRTGVGSTVKTSDGRRLTSGEVQQIFGLTDAEADTGDVGRLVMRAVLLHTDITVNVDDYDPQLHPRPLDAPRRAILVIDGRNEGIGDTGPHWELARALLDLLPPDSPRTPEKRRWYIASAAFMRSRGHQAALMPHLAHASLLYPEDAELHLYRGCMHETLASPSIQRAIQSLTGVPRTQVAVRDARTHFEQARAQFRAALDSDRGLVEARVRLGYVLVALGRHEEAVSELQRALAHPPDPRLHYLAALFLGGAQARLGRHVAARAAYEQAAALYPLAQSPRLALSSLARAAGDRSESARLLLSALPSTHDATLGDPWWEYFGLSMVRAEQLLLDWRRSIVSGSEP